MGLRVCVLLLALVVGSNALLGSKKNVTVTGKVNCGRVAARDTVSKIELWEDDTLNFDDLLNSTQVGPTGQFKVFGATREIRKIEPYILITHNCVDGKKDVRCTIKDRYDIPQTGIGKTHDLGTIDLDQATKKRKKDCK